MTAKSRVSLAWPTLLGAALLLVAVGAGGTYLGLRSGEQSRSVAGEQPIATPGMAAVPATPTAPPGAASNPTRALPDVEVTLTKEGVERAGIVVVPVLTGVVRRGLAGTRRSAGQRLPASGRHAARERTRHARGG